MAATAEDEEEYLDDADIEDPWDRMDRLGGALQAVARNRNREKVTPARQLMESLEQRIKEADDVND